MGVEPGVTLRVKRGGVKPKRADRCRVERSGRDAESRYRNRRRVV